MRKSSRISTLLATMALAITGMPAVAQQQQPQRPQVVSQFDDTMVRYLLADVQATYRTEQASDGSSVYRASAEGGINFTLAQRSCAPETGCLGLMLIAIFTDVPIRDPARFDAFVHAFNDQNPTAKMIRSPDGVVAIQSYINAAYGISYRNAQVQFVVFGQNIVQASRALAAFEQQQGG